MMRKIRFPEMNLLVVLVILMTASMEFVSAQTDMITPEKFFGFKPGSDGNLFTYEELISYLQKIAPVSPRLKLLEAGKSPMGRPMYILFISAEENISNLEELKSINKKLALDPNLTGEEKKALLEKGKVFVLATLSMHSGEVAPTQSLPLLAYDLATTRDTAVLERLNEVVLMIVPNHNPDGMDMIVEHYRKYKGTKYESSDMPGLYHRYVGHDNNRDFITLTQEDTRAIARIYNLDWYPQVMVEKHQMGSTGPRFFVPPVHDPIAENIDASIWNWTGIYGSSLITDLTARGLAGISQHYLFDDYWPGSTETCIWKNVIGFLTEAASVNYASPIYIEPTELRVYGKGLSEYKKSINMPLVWTGGWWRLGDIVDLELESMYSILRTSYLNKYDILKLRTDLCQKEVHLGLTQSPYYYIMPLRQHDLGELVRLVALLQEHGVQCYHLASNLTLNGFNYTRGDVVLPLAQPFRPFIKEVMEKQEYPLRHYTPGGEIIKPYDITSWSLPLHRGITAIEITERSAELEKWINTLPAGWKPESTIPAQFWAAVLPVRENESFKTAFRFLQEGLKVERIEESFTSDAGLLEKGSFLVYSNPAKKAFIDQIWNELAVSPVFLPEPCNVKTSVITMPRIALVETYFHDMDAGWTRFVLDSYSIPFKVLRPGDFKKTDLVKNFDIVVFPDNDKSILMEGKWKPEEGEDYYISSYPPEYTEGIGKEGFQKVLQFLEQGGIVVSWGNSTDLFKGTLTREITKEKKEEFRLPFDNIATGLRKAGLYCPGSLVKMELLSGHPLTLGMQEKSGVFFRGEPVFTTSIPEFDMDRRVVGKFPEKEILLSGYCEKEEQLSNRSVLLWLKKGKGQLVLMGFNPQFRASTTATYKILFNALLLTRG